VDIDGNVYSTVIIGIQEWMAENLKVIHYRNGDNIPTGHPNNEWEELNEYETGAYCVYEDEPINAEIYGNLYNKYAVDDDRGICPDGWHVPSDEEFIELELYLGMSEEVTHDYNWRGTNEGSMLAGNAELWPDNELLSHEEFGYSGFDAIPGGFRRPYGVYENIGLNAYFWTFTPDYSGYYWFREVSQFHSNIFRNTYPRQSGLSVRCVRD